MIEFKLYEDFESTTTKKILKSIEIDGFILNNLNKNIILRDYQKDAIKKFIYYFNNKEDYQSRIEDSDLFYKNKNHVLFNMATGSGKTVLMACFILYLYQKGYNNFLFLSHLNSINVKTFGNLIDKSCNKYLFNRDSNLNIVEGSYSDLKDKDINIIIDTYSGLSSKKSTIRENSFSLDSLKDRKIVIIADESHHLNAGIDTEGGVWEKDVNDILNINKDNFLLEFTATIKWDDLKLKNKYESKCLVKYDLRKFYEEKWTKNIDLLLRSVDLENLMFGGVVLNKYRELLFLNNTLTPVKPVIMFKSDKVDNSKSNHKKFLNLINNLNKEYLKNFRCNLSSESPIKIAFDYLIDYYNTYENLINVIKNDFSEEYIINTNLRDDVENGKNAKLLNSLEDKNNQKRIIFTVDKLNEGWDVLNLFDIVKLYETQTEKQTVQEARLIGRGARYCNFDLDINLFNYEKNKRKFDNNFELNNLNVLEQLYFHSKQDINTIKKLKYEIEKIRPEKEMMQIPIKIKDDLESVLQNIPVFKNEIVDKKLICNDYNIYEEIRKLLKKFRFKNYSGKENIIKLEMNEDDDNASFTSNDVKNIKIGENIEKYIQKSALINNTDYNFEELYKKLEIKSFDEFLEKLDDYELIIENCPEKLNNKLQYNIFKELLIQINKLLKKEIQKKEGTLKFANNSFFKNNNKGIFRKTMILNREKNNNEIKIDNDYYVYDNAYLTSEEQSFIDFFNRKIYEELTSKFDKIFLVRNENDLKLYQFKNGKGFEPDFVLFLINTNTKQNLEVFIEPKGNKLINDDEEKAKNEFLQSITLFSNNNEIVFDKTDDKFYKIFGLQFYNKDLEDDKSIMEKEFRKYIFVV